MAKATNVSTSFGRTTASIVHTPPGPESRRLALDLSLHESSAVSTISAGDMPIVWARARGSNVQDVDGNIYVDLTGAFGVASLGHGDPHVARAVRRQVGLLAHGLGDVHPHDIRVELTRRLAELAFGGDGKVILCSTGAEAVEVALKTATLYTGKKRFLAFEGGFHGQTYGALAVTWRERFRRPFGEQVYSGVYRAPYAYCYRCPLGLTYPDCAISCLVEAERVLDSASGRPEIGAVIVEPVQGREGDIVPPPDYLPRLADICRSRGVLLILDEMITGFSRTGAWFAKDHRGVRPDLLCVGKAMGNGLPISACVGRPEVMDAWKPEGGEAPHSSTFMANPVTGAAALAAITEHERLGLPERAQAMGAYILRRLEGLKQAHPLIGDVRGLGMMLGIELVLDRQSKEPATGPAGTIIARALAEGVILLGSGHRGNIISLSPPLTITRRQVDYALNVLDRALAAAEA